MIRPVAPVLAGLGLLLTLAVASACTPRSHSTAQSLIITVSEDVRGTTVTVVRRRESTLSGQGGIQGEITEETLPIVLIPTGEQRGSVRLEGRHEYQLLSAVKTAGGITVSLTEDDRQ